MYVLLFDGGKLSTFVCMFFCLTLVSIVRVYIFLIKVYLYIFFCEYICTYFYEGKLCTNALSVDEHCTNVSVAQLDMGVFFGINWRVFGRDGALIV